jgi:hypothetical protein
MMILKCKALGCLVFAIVVCSMALGARAEVSQEQSGRNFVQEFYSWYNKPAAKPGQERTPKEALKLRSDAFDAELRNRLKEDFDAQAKVTGEIVGLDMDPFLDTNSDPYERYVTGKVTPKAGAFLVDIYGMNAGKKTAKPVVTPEVKYQGRHWQFVNFHYSKSKFPENDNLLSVLKALRQSREKYPK